MCVGSQYNMIKYFKERSVDRINPLIKQIHRHHALCGQDLTIDL